MNTYPFIALKISLPSENSYFFTLFARNCVIFRAKTTFFKRLFAQTTNFYHGDPIYRSGKRKGNLTRGLAITGGGDGSSSRKTQGRQIAKIHPNFVAKILI